MSTAIKTNIKRKLEAQNMSAAELERRTGIPHAVVNILHGRSKNPSLRTAQAIAKELGCSVEDLLHEYTETRSDDTGDWREDLYMQACKAVCAEIANSNIDPKPEDVSKCVSEVYKYTLGSPKQTIDSRFVSWVIKDL